MTSSARDDLAAAMAEAWGEMVCPGSADEDHWPASGPYCGQCGIPTQLLAETALAALTPERWWAYGIEQGWIEEVFDGPYGLEKRDASELLPEVTLLYRRTEGS